MKLVFNTLVVVMLVAGTACSSDGKGDKIADNNHGDEDSGGSPSAWENFVTRGADKDPLAIEDAATLQSEMNNLYGERDGEPVGIDPTKPINRINLSRSGIAL